MKNFNNKIAVITGAGTGIGRELALQLTSEGCHIAICDILTENMRETEELCRKIAKPDVRITTYEGDVSDEAQMKKFCTSVKEKHATDHINLLFNNAGVNGGGSFLLDDRKEWDRVFEINWLGTYYSTRTFMPLLRESLEGHIVNISSFNGFWACLGPFITHTAYSSAKFAVKGFTEALQIDLRLNAPHVKASLVMPGHIGTSISSNQNEILGKPSFEEMSPEELSFIRKKINLSMEELNDDALKSLLQEQNNAFKNNAPMTAAQCVTAILEGIRKKQWRILVGEDAIFLDRMVREHPETAYEPSFMKKLAKENKMGAHFMSIIHGQD